MIDSRDSKYIEGTQPSQLSTTMNNTELTLDQLSEVAGGPHYTTYGGSSFISRAIIHSNYKRAYMSVSISLEGSKQED